MLVDQLTAEVNQRFEQAGIECMLVKGPVIGEWLYADGVRPYNDSDLLVSNADWDRAMAILIDLGLHDYVEALEHPRLESDAAKGFARGADNLDLHRTLPGLEAAPETVWEALWPSADRQFVGGHPIAVPSRQGVLMHIALHAAAHHAEPKPREDLRRAIAVATIADWREAVALAHRLDGLPAFASGLRSLPEGAELAGTLGLEDVGSVHFDLRASGVPTAEALHELIAPGLTARQRAATVLRELLPTPSFMRWWTPLARRGAIGLLAAYPFRWAWLAVKLPGGLLELRRAQRRRPTS
jgi:hypothetical protein